MSRLGDFYENRITGERVVVLRGDEDAAPGESGFGHLTVAPHGAVAGEHVHPRISERFIVISGTLGVRLDGIERRLGAGEEATARPGVAHDWWNADLKRFATSSTSTAARGSRAAASPRSSHPSSTCCSSRS